MDLLAFVMTGNQRSLLVAIPSLLTFIAVVWVAVVALRALLRIDRSLQELVQRSRVVGAPVAPAADRTP